jgi:hypothetical protein
MTIVTMKTRYQVMKNRSGVLDQKPDQGGQHRRNHQRAPIAERRRQRVGKIAAERQEIAVGEIDDIAEIEDERQAERHQHVERADDQPVGHVEQYDLRHPPSAFQVLALSGRVRRIRSVGS